MGLSSKPSYPYDLNKLPREKAPFYISATDSEINEMLATLNLKSLDQLYDHIPKENKFENAPNLGQHISYNELVKHLENVASKNNIKSNFIGDALQVYKVPKIVEHVCSIRGLTTAYTPYQPERGQGTLIGLWIYSSLMSQLTDIEAVNASLYDRSTAIYEAIQTAIRSSRGPKNRAIICESILPQDWEVLETLAKETNTQYVKAPIDPKSGLTDLNKLKELLKSEEGICALVFPQVNSLGLLENVHELTDLCTEHQLYSIAVIDPVTLAKGALCPPGKFGKDQQGVHMIVGEAQHLALGANYGGPGLGIFGVRYNQKDRKTIRQSPGRFISKAKDNSGRDCYTLVLSTREQHIRREKATSNICSNQSFAATLVGAALLERGEEGLAKAASEGQQKAINFAKKLTRFKGLKVAFPETPFFNEVTIETPIDSHTLISKAAQNNIHIGVDVSSRIPGNTRNLIKISFTDLQTSKDLELLNDFFTNEFKIDNEIPESKDLAEIAPTLKRQHAPGLPTYNLKRLQDFYTSLGKQNVTPDDNIYALGSCTMKYNPYVNDYAASLPGFTSIHPQAPTEDAQGNLEVLYSIQETFKTMTGLAAVTTQPVAGAQGELVGLKMFQAYHRDRGEGDERNLILIPRSAHGTNPATATMAGYETKKIDGKEFGIILIEATPKGQIDLEQVRRILKDQGNRIAGVMVTNPNTSGIFEIQFAEMSKLIHEVGGLVYMDGANMNAIAGWVNLENLGVDAVHNNLHKTWTIPHGGGGPGDAIVAVSHRLVDYLPGLQVVKEQDRYVFQKAPKSIGSFHRHHGNFAHKVRCYSYLKALGTEGVRKMSAVAVLAARYLYHHLSQVYPILPSGSEQTPRMHEFIITLPEHIFANAGEKGIAKSQVIPQTGKVFLDFGLHAPTVAFPEVYGLMLEPTESFTKEELDRFIEIVKSIYSLVSETPEVLITAPHFTTVDKIDEVQANKTPQLSENLHELPQIYPHRISVEALNKMSIGEICKSILEAHQEKIKTK